MYPLGFMTMAAYLEARGLRVRVVNLAVKMLHDRRFDAGAFIRKLKTRAFTIGSGCKNHRDCINDLGCPAFYIEADRVRIDPVLCTGCAVCAQVCPENAIRPVKEA